MTTRKYGSGALFQRQTDLRWIGRLPDGRGGHRHFTGTDRDDVERRLEAARRERDRTISHSPRGGERLRDLMDRYLTTVAPIRNRARTLEDHRQVSRDHIVPVIGAVRVTQLQARDVQRMVNRMAASGLSPKTTQNAVGVLSAALRHAMREGIVERNVASLAVVAPVTRERLPSLTTAQVRSFLADTRGEPLWPIWVLAGTTGMRIGEVLGLLWRDVTPTTVTVTGQYRYAGIVDGAETWERVEPKTPKSRRTLHLPSLAREAMTVAKAQAHSTKLVFSNKAGHPLNRSWVTRAFSDALTAHGYPSVRLHSLRHSSAVAMLDNVGGDLRAVSAVLGHSTLAVTTDLYGAEADDARRRGARAMDEAMEERA